MKKASENVNCQRREKVFALKIYNSKKQGEKYLFFVNSGKILLELYSFFS